MGNDMLSTPRRRCWLDHLQPQDDTGHAVEHEPPPQEVGAKLPNIYLMPRTPVFESDQSPSQPCITHVSDVCITHLTGVPDYPLGQPLHMPSPPPVLSHHQILVLRLQQVGYDLQKGQRPTWALQMDG